MASIKYNPCSRRRFLSRATNLGLISAYGLSLLTNNAVAEGLVDSESADWGFQKWHPAPENTIWRVLDFHPTGYVNSASKLKDCDLISRLEFDSVKDGLHSYRHKVRKGEIVHPLGIDSARVKADFSSFSRVLLRYHQWIGNYSGLPGKWIGLQLGKGWVGRKYALNSDDLYGGDGGSATTMHPARDGHNGIRLLATHAAQSTPYGENVGKGETILPLGKWLTVDVVVDRYEGHRLYVDGQILAQSEKVTPVHDWESCKVLWYRNRHMHGGTPELLPSRTAYSEWFGGFYVAVV